MRSIRNTYWVISLSVILTFSLMLPLCAHANIQKVETHQNQVQSHTTHNHASDCTCGHQLIEAFQKVNNPVLNRLHEPLSAMFESDFSLPIDRLLFLENINRSVSFDEADPPIYLLNSVFLN